MRYAHEKRATGARRDEQFGRPLGPCWRSMRALSHKPAIWRTSACERRRRSGELQKCATPIRTGSLPLIGPTTRTPRNGGHSSGPWRESSRLSDDSGLPAPIFASLNHGVYLRRPTNYAKPDRLVSTFLRWHRQGEIAAGTLGYIVMNFHEEIADRLQGRSLVVNALDNHPSAALNQLYADTLYPIVRTIVEREGRSATEMQAEQRRYSAEPGAGSSVPR